MDSKNYFTDIIFDINNNKTKVDLNDEIISDYMNNYISEEKYVDIILNKLGYFNNLEKLNSIKSCLELLGQKEWDCLKKRNNPFESITSHNGIANYCPISRAYFKMIEIIYCFREEIINVISLDKNEPFVTLHLAEGPGGFIECLNEFFLENKYKNYEMYGITLIREEKNIPGWRKLRYFLEYYENIKLLFGKNGTGDLYDIDNIYDICEKLPRKAIIITGDGGFDYSNDFNHQENLTFPLIYCQTMTALLCQKIDGIFILKIFDIYNTKTMYLINILKENYKIVKIIKPYTSRPGNSEKYLVCIGFLNNITPNEIHKLLLDIPKIGLNNGNKNLEIYNYFNKNIDFYKKLMEINEVFFERQREFILDTLELKNGELLESKKEKLLEIQINNSIKWCKLYNFKINFLSKFILSYLRESSNS
jgi:23S rRNA U2552 (ribose-2'-O)-methylase RlmE/FtsJ